MIFRFVVLGLVLAELAFAGEPKPLEAEYVALSEKTQIEYRKDPESAYRAELTFVEYVKDSMRREVPFPDKTVLAWAYPRVALAAEYSGRKEAARHLWVYAEQYWNRVYPNQPIDSAGRFKTLRDAVIYMDREAHVSWVR